VTGWRALFFNPGFVTAIVGVPKLESEAIIAYLTGLVATAVEAQVRFVWQEGDVAIWDNRVTTHSASYGFVGHGQRRHAVRVAARAEKQVGVSEVEGGGKSQEEEAGIVVKKDGSGEGNYND